MIWICPSLVPGVACRLTRCHGYWGMSSVDLNVVFFCVCRVFIDQCFRPFSATLLDDGVYKTLCKETNRYIQAVNSAVEQSVFVVLFCYVQFVTICFCVSWYYHYACSNVYLLLFLTEIDSRIASALQDLSY